MLLLLMPIPAALGGLHYLLRKAGLWLLPCGALGLSVLAVLLLRRYAQLEWSNVE
jgi:hypothetical protein